ncbi:hypothetical protein, partial [Parasynechococcus sp.]|uniref:hypothetical protein n=1 Tax=Parasynechococcus sp. TaxID=3101203 RepID=UPI00370430A7
MKDADTIVIIGSSPILLLTAISLARRGKKVSIISSNTEWGGAWKYSSFDNNFIDIACHLLESNKRVHDLLRAYNVNLRKCTLGNEAVKYIANSEKENANIFLYHSKLQVLQEMFTRFRRLIFAFLKYLISSDAEKGFSLETALNELIIYLRFRASQLFNLEPLHIPSNGWSNFVIDLTNEARQNSVHFIDDFVSDIEDRGLFFVAKTNKE